MTAVLAVSWRWRGAFIGRVRGCMLRGSETWPVKKENKLTLQRAEMRMIRWMCNRFTCSELRQRLGIGDIITVIQRHRLRWYGHVLRKNENEGVKKMHGLWSGRCKMQRSTKEKAKSGCGKRLSDPTTKDRRLTWVDLENGPLNRLLLSLIIIDLFTDWER